MFWEQEESKGLEYLSFSDSHLNQSTYESFLKSLIIKSKTYLLLNGK